MFIISVRGKSLVLLKGRDLRLPLKVSRINKIIAFLRLHHFM